MLILNSGAPAARPAVAATDTYLVAHGDSITIGAGLGFWAGQQPWPTLIGQSIATNKGKVVKVWNCGISGQGFNYVFAPAVAPNNLINDAPITVDPLLSHAGITKYLGIFIGTNDLWSSLGNSTAAQTLAFFDTYITARLAAGWTAGNICVFTCLPRQGGFGGTKRADFNSGLVSRVVTYGYTIARLDLDANIGADGDETNTTYFQSDLIHPTSVGQIIVGNIGYAALFP